MPTLRRGPVVYLSKGSAKCLVTVAMGSTLVFLPRSTSYPKSSNILPMLEETINNFKNNVDVSRLSKNLRNLLLHYQTVVNDGHPFEMEDLLTDILPLFELLDEFEKT